MKTYVLKKNLIILSGLVMLITLTGCAGGRFDTKESTKVLLPQIVQYDAAIQKQALAELESGQCKAHVEFAKDYVQLRDRLRLIKSELE